VAGEAANTFQRLVRPRRWYAVGSGAARPVTEVPRTAVGEAVATGLVVETFAGVATASAAFVAGLGGADAGAAAGFGVSTVVAETPSQKPLE
jgi:hypothetical protein